MRKQHFLLALGLAFAALATTPAGAAQDEAGRQVRKASKQSPKVQPSSRKPVAKKPLAKKPAAGKAVAKKPLARKPIAKKPAPRPAPLAAADRPSTDTQSRITRPGDYKFAVQHGGQLRTYRLHVPPGYSMAEPAPLLVALHGGGTDQHGNDGFHGIMREADRQGFIAVFPEAWKRPGQGQIAAWNAGTCCGDAHDQKIDDVRFIEAVVTNVFWQMSVDRQRIYATGFSDGGMMAYRLACERPHVFRAVASVAGTDNTVSCTPDRPVPVLHFHARNDARVPFAGAPESAVRGKPAGLTSVPETIGKWAQLNGCMEAPRRVLDQGGASCQTHTYCRARADVQLCVTDSGGHSWPGARARRGEDTPSQDLAATRAMWTFFSAR